MKNLSINGDIEDAKSALLLFAGNPNEITMEGLFSSIALIENLNKNIVIRYGDYPIVGSRKIASVVLFSGIKRLRFT
jgi:cell division GTPase FtsZ